MPDHRPAPLRHALLALACACAAAGSHAAPQDGLAELLAERGLIESGADLGRQMRDTTSGLVVAAMNFLGVPYKRGGNSSEDGFDCSGFTRHIYESVLGLVLPRRVDEQAKAPGFAPVKRDELQPGDLVFFNTLRRTFSHVGIYIGDGKFIHAPRSGAEIRVESMRVKYWAQRYTGARRAGHAQPPVVAAAAESRAAAAIPNDYSP